MAMDSAGGARRRTIATAIAAELKHQAQTGASRIDVDALAVAIDDALDPGAGVDAAVSEGKRPAELNATNDD